jgi:hypothetical protein
MWNASRGQEALTVQVSHPLGLLVSHVALLYLKIPLSSHFDGEEGVWMGIIGHCVGLCLSIVTSSIEPRKQKKVFSYFTNRRNKQKKKLTAGPNNDCIVWALHCVKAGHFWVLRLVWMMGVEGRVVVVEWWKWRGGGGVVEVVEVGGRWCHRCRQRQQ